MRRSRADVDSEQHFDERVNGSSTSRAERGAPRVTSSCRLGATSFQKLLPPGFNTSSRLAKNFLQGSSAPAGELVRVSMSWGRDKQ